VEARLLAVFVVLPVIIMSFNIVPSVMCIQVWCWQW